MCLPSGLRNQSISVPKRLAYRPETYTEVSRELARFFVGECQLYNCPSLVTVYPQTDLRLSRLSAYVA